MKKLSTLLLLFASILLQAQTKKINVYVFVAEDCPISIYMANPIKEIVNIYKANANFTLVFPLENSTIKTANKFKIKNGLVDFNIIIDKKQILTKKLDGRVTPEVIVTNEYDSILYKGRINDAYLEPGKRRHIYNCNDLSAALSLIIQNREVPKPWKQAIGCFITMKK